MNRDKAFECDDGVFINGGPFITGGPASPVGLDLPTDTMYFQTSTPTGTLVWKKFGGANSDWRQLSSSDVPFENAGTTIKSTDVRAAMAELRNQTVFNVSSQTSTLNGTFNLDLDSSSLLVVLGSATGFSVALPNATTLFAGHRFEIQNTSTQSIFVKRFDGSVLSTVISGDTIIVTLTDNSTSAGLWNSVLVTTVAAGINAFNVTQSTTFSTTSATDTLVTGLSETPPSGTYGVWFSSDITIATNNRIAECVLFKDGLAVTDTRRSQQGLASNFKTALQTLGIISVNGSQAIDVRVNVSGGTLNLLGRSLLLIRLGGET
jgi:hypothetical protein